MICKNCGNIFEGHYCNNCGQKSNVGRIGFLYLFEEVTNGVFQVNKGILYTIKALTISPGLTIREFIEGKRQKHFKPLSFLFIIASVYALSTYLLDINTTLGEFLSGILSAFESSENETITVCVLNWMANHYAYSILIFMPFLSSASFLAFRGYNYFEHLVLNIYITGQQILIYLLFSILFLFIDIDDSLLQLLPVALGVLYTLWTYCQFFEKKKTISKILLTILTYIYYLIQLTLLLVLAVFVEMSL